MCQITARVKSQFRHPALRSIPESSGLEAAPNVFPKRSPKQDFHGKQWPKNGDLGSLAVVAVRNSELRAWPTLNSFCCALAQERRSPGLPFQHPSASPWITLILLMEPRSLSCLSLSDPSSWTLPAEGLEKPVANSRRQQQESFPNFTSQQVAGRKCSRCSAEAG